MPKVRVILSMHPDRPVEVDDGEVPVLRAQGILLEVEGETAAKDAGKPEGTSGDAGSGGDAGTADNSAPAAGKRAKSTP